MECKRKDSSVVMVVASVFALPMKASMLKATDETAMMIMFVLLLLLLLEQNRRTVFIVGTIDWAQSMYNVDSMYKTLFPKAPYRSRSLLLFPSNHDLLLSP